MRDLPKLISARQAAQIMGKTKRWATSLLREGKIAGQLVDGFWVTTRAAVEQYISEQSPNKGRSK